MNSNAKPDGVWEIVHADCLIAMREMPAESIDAIVTDPPYFRVKPDSWDRQWNDSRAFLQWMAQLAEQWKRILKPNGTLYCFASPQMAASVELVIAEQFRVLNSIVWVKPTGRHLQTCVAAQRQFFPQTERIVMAEQFNKSRSTDEYSRECAKARARVFAPIREYLNAEREKAGLSRAEVDAAWRAWKGIEKGGMASHWFGESQWSMPTRENYEWLQSIFNRAAKREALGDSFDHLQQRYEILKKTYNELLYEFSKLRRPFQLQRGDQNTDVWTFKPVQFYPGKHPCEKPQSLMEHIIKASTLPGQLVLDCFVGSGATGVACLNLGRRFLGIEMDEQYCKAARARLGAI